MFSKRRKRIRREYVRTREQERGKRKEGNSDAAEPETRRSCDAKRPELRRRRAELRRRR